MMKKLFVVFVGFIVFAFLTSRSFAQQAGAGAAAGAAAEAAAATTVGITAGTIAAAVAVAAAIAAAIAIAAAEDDRAAPVHVTPAHH
ncbi:MAG: hypothetical protein RMJ39_01980 [Deltaproteobacteria bacterium]|nr:hypothetical protein [Deltaproteobacteria bacterium]